jgi:hypothetical protein
MMSHEDLSGTMANQPLPGADPPQNGPQPPQASVSHADYDTSHSSSRCTTPARTNGALEFSDSDKPLWLVGALAIERTTLSCDHG